MSDPRSVYRAAFERWGVEAQLRMAVEECAELSEAICHYFRGRCTRQTLAEEVADVEIMMEQLRAIIGEDLVSEVKNKKLKRLEERLSEEER